MTEKENKAIEIVKEIWQFTDYSTDKIVLKVVLDLLEKLQKENEELKKPKDNIQVVYGGRNYGKTNFILKEYISKDKIRETIKQLQDDESEYVEHFNEIWNEHTTLEVFQILLKELLEEE